MPESPNLPDKISDSTGETDQDTVIVLLKLFESQQAELICNMAGQPCLQLRSQPLSTVPLHSPRATALLAEYAWRKTGHALTGAQLSQLIRILAGMAWRSDQIEPSGPPLWERIAEEPVAQAVIGLMDARDQQSFHGTMTELLLRLQETAIARGILCGKRWPRIPNLLSTTLRELTPVLGAVGFEITWKRTGRARRVTIAAVACTEPGDNGDDHSSQTPSPGNIIHGNCLTPDDEDDDAGRDEIISRIKAVARGESP